MHGVPVIAKSVPQIPGPSEPEVGHGSFGTCHMSSPRGWGFRDGQDSSTPILASEWVRC